MKTSPKSVTTFLFILVVCALFFAGAAAFLPERCSAALPQTAIRFAKSEAALDALTKDSAQAKYRTSWEKIFKEFMAIYADKKWPNRPKALFRAAETMEQLSRHSFSNADALKAAETYEQLAARHKNSVLADDALYRAAKIHTAMLHDDAKALQLLAKLKKLHPKGDMLAEAEALEKTIKAKDAPIARKEKVPSQNMTRNSESEKSGDYELTAAFESVEKRVKQLKNDKRRVCWRQPWEIIESDLLAIHKKARDRSLGVRAISLAAMARQHIAECSRVLPDYKSAQELHLTVYQYFPKSPLAHESLYESAKILCDKLDDTRQARRLLTDFLRRYPKSRTARPARTLLAKITKNDVLGSPVALETLTWDSVDKNRVEITLRLTGRTNYSARLVSEAKGSQKHLFLDLNGTKIDSSIRKGVIIRGSLLEGIFVEKEGSSTLRFDLRDARRFDVSTKPDSCNLLITVDARKNVTPKTSQSGQNVAAKKKKTFTCHLRKKS